MQKLDRFGWMFLVLGAGMLANAGWMLAGPMHWYTELPAEVPDFGPFNPHFVRDIGCAFATIGMALVWAAFSPRFRLPLVGVSAFFLTGHALVHVYDMLRGAVASYHWWLDLPGVYLPAGLLGISTAILKGREGGDRTTST